MEKKRSSYVQSTLCRLQHHRYNIIPASCHISAASHSRNIRAFNRSKRESEKVISSRSYSYPQQHCDNLETKKLHTKIHACACPQVTHWTDDNFVSGDIAWMGLKDVAGLCYWETHCCKTDGYATSETSKTWHCIYQRLHNQYGMCQ